MANGNQEWESLGRNIQNIIDQAVNSQDYEKLNQTIHDTISQAIEMGGNSLKNAAGRKLNYTEQLQEQIRQQKQQPVLYDSSKTKSAIGIIKIAAGAVLAGFNGFMTLGSMILSYMEPHGVGDFAGFWALFAFVGIGLMVNGILQVDKVNRFKKYLKCLGSKTYCNLKQMARAVGHSTDYVCKDLNKMINQGWFLEAHVTDDAQSLITSDETYNYYLQTQKQILAQKEQEIKDKHAQEEKKEQAKATAEVQSVLDRGNAFIREIHACNDAIPGEEISEKIARIENIVGQIFERAEAHPEIIPDLKKLMDYYLPMTVKLLNAYKDMDAQPIQGENIRKSKKEIEDTLDTLNLAFEKLLDSVFKDTALDVSSDISVLHTLLAQEGLEDDDFTRMRQESEAKADQQIKLQL